MREREREYPYGGPHTGSVQFIFWAELRYLSLPAFVPSTAIPRAAFDVNGTNRPLLRAPVRVCTLKRVSMQVHMSVSRAQYPPTCRRRRRSRSPSGPSFRHVEHDTSLLFPESARLLSALFDPARRALTSAGT